MMKKWLLIIFLCSVLQGMAQEGLRTVVTQGPVNVGEPFQVQYVMGEMQHADEFYQPEFKGFRIVSGPQVYTGQTYGPDGNLVQVRNIVYTVIGLKPGLSLIPGASAKINGKMVRSKGSSIEVVDRQAQQVQDKMLGDYYLRAGEDPYKKIRQNLFVKVEVDRRNCYVGQPVTAVFKLYSTLESRSDIVKNPGLYGFTVQDMIGLQERKVSIETVKGKKFDVHTIRKVQMYALRPGVFEVDPMEVRNRVEFYKAAVPGKTDPEQDIREGVIEPDDFRSLVNTAVYESSMSTEPVKITVIPTPETARPDSFNGALGKFQISSALIKDKVHTNEEGILEVRISGEGNFTQLSAPDISWPAGITAFDPEIKDQLDPETSPLKGERLFRYHFVSGKPGKHELPSVVLSFFNPDSNRYQTLTTKAIPLTVVDSVKKAGGIRNALNGAKPAGWFRISIILAGCLLMTGFITWLIYRKKKASSGTSSGKGTTALTEPGKTDKTNSPVYGNKETTVPAAPGKTKFPWGVPAARKPATPPSRPETPARPAIRELLAPAALLVYHEDKQFYVTLRQGIWQFFSGHFSLTGSKQGRNNLMNVMRASAIDAALQQEVAAILDHCEAGMFTDMSSGNDQAEWLQRTRDVLESIEKGLPHR